MAWRILALLAMLLAFPLFTSAQAERQDDASATSRANNQDGVRASFDGSDELPDGIAFREFVSIVEDDGPEIYDLVAIALGMKLTDRTLPVVQERMALFRRANDSMHQEDQATSYKMLCSDNRFSRASDDTYNVLNDVDDVHELIVEKHYVITSGFLPAQERKAFATFLSDMKSGISYVKVDSRVSAEPSQNDISHVVGEMCSDLSQSLRSQ